MKLKPEKGETRSVEELREHYKVEKELAHCLRNANRDERRELYSSLYDAMYKRVPSHPQLTRKMTPRTREFVVAAQMRLLRPFLTKETTFLELGPGDCSLAFEVAKHVKQVNAVDVSDEITKSVAQPENFRLILSDGCSVPLPPGSVDVAYSNQLMEHLHPDDAMEQLCNIFRALRPGGVYVCMTPNRLSGPHDISKYFDDVAVGFHLKEYTVKELGQLLQEVGFKHIRVYLGGKGKYLKLRTFPIECCEGFISRLPNSLRKSMVQSVLFKLLLGIRMVGVK